jgi:hypothetical protein
MKNIRAVILGVLAGLVFGLASALAAPPPGFQFVPEWGLYARSDDIFWHAGVQWKLQGGACPPGGQRDATGTGRPGHALFPGGPLGRLQEAGEEFVAASRPTRGILLVLSNCTDPAREAAFHRWYEDIHVADILETGAFHTAYRYESLAPQATQAQYLALYETEQRDPAKAREALGQARADWGQRGRLSDTIRTPLRWWRP